MSTFTRCLLSGLLGFKRAKFTSWTSTRSGFMTWLVRECVLLLYCVDSLLIDELVSHHTLQESLFVTFSSR